MLKVKRELNVHVLRIEWNFVKIVAEIGQRMKKYDSI
jgi:hypothetical protein